METAYRACRCSLSCTWVVSPVLRLVHPDLKASLLETGCLARFLHMVWCPLCPPLDALADDGADEQGQHPVRKLPA